MRRIVFIIIITFFALSVSCLSAQLSINDRLDIQREISLVLNHDFTAGGQAVSNEQFLSRNLVKNKIKQAIKDGNLALALSYFSGYSAILDTLVITEPAASKQIVTNLKTLYVSIPTAMEELSYYTGAADYYLSLYNIAKAELAEFFTQYPAANHHSAAMSLLLKSYINSNSEKDALSFIQSGAGSFNDEQNFLSGQIAFTAEQDVMAEALFRKVSGSSYLSDATDMLELISILKLEPVAAKSQLESALKAKPNNPFILLSLARTSSLTGEWTEAEKYYSGYASAKKSQQDYRIQYELATNYLNLGNHTKAIQLLDSAIQNNNISEYVCPLLYLWAELNTYQGQADVARNRTNKVNQVVLNNIDLITQKTVLLNNVIILKTGLEGKVNLNQINPAISELKSISGQLDVINSTISNEQYGVSNSSLRKGMLIESQVIGSVAQQLYYYLLADQIKNVQDTLNVKQLESLEAIYREHLKRIEAIRLAALKLNDQNAYLAVRNEIDSNIEVLDGILASLYQMKARPNHSEKNIDLLIAETERKKTETIMLLDYYDFDNSEYRAIMSEVKASNEETLRLIDTVRIAKAELRDIYPKYLSSREKKVILNDLENLSLLQPEYTTLCNNQLSYLEAVKLDVEYTGIHINYVETAYYDLLKKQQESSLSFAESQALFNENQARKQAVYNQILPFISKFGGLKNNLSNVVNPDVNILAGAYFTIAELGNSLWTDRQSDNLANYKHALELDPKFYLADVILYNVGYLSSSIVKNRIETANIGFGYAGSEYTKPENLRYTESSYAEAIQAYKKIIDDYEGSPYYSEAVYRLGYLFFEIGTDANRPVEYYAIARDYYNQLIDRNNDPYHYKALYQRGWTWLNSSSEEAYKSGIDDFVAILKAIDQNRITDETEKVDYSVTSVKNIGYCLVGLDGADNVSEAKGAAYALNNLVTAVNPDNLNLILDDATAQKLKLYLPIQAVDYMRAKLTLSPLNPLNPIVADSICNIYKANPGQIKRGASPSETYFAAREAIITDYGYDSAWYNQNKNGNIDKQLQVIGQSFAEVQKHYNNVFVDSPTQDNFKKYITLSQQYESLKPTHDQQYAQWADDTRTTIIAQNLKLAQMTGDFKQYLALANRIYDYNDTNPDNKMFIELEGNAYDCARVISDSLKIDLAAAKKADPSLYIPLTSDLHPEAYYNNAAERFAQFLISDKYKSDKNDLVYMAVVSRQAEIFKTQQDFEKSNIYYQKIVEFPRTVSADIKRSVLINMGENYESLKNYLQAEKSYTQAEQYALNKNDKAAIHQYALLQIQNSVDQAQQNGNNIQAAEGYMRLADIYAATDKTKSLQYKGKAQAAYLDAKDYNKSIDLLSDMSKDKSKANDAFMFDRVAWSVADSVGLSEKSVSLRQDFVNRYPTSTEAYQVRIDLADRQAASAATAAKAVDMYMALYDDVTAKRINAGNDNPGNLYIAALAACSKAGDETRKEQLAEQFLQKYPNHTSSVVVMEYLADRLLAAGNDTRYEQLAKAIYQKDKANDSRYTNAAKNKLKKIATSFNDAYTAKNWADVNARMDEFKRTHTAYEKEGLKLDFTPVYEDFTIASAEYEEVKAKLAFDKSYNQQISATERGFLAQKPDQLMRVNINTRWKTNLAGGDNRIQVLKNTTLAEINKIKNLLESGAQYEMTPDMRLKGLDLICRVADYGSEAFKTQVDKYMSITIEFNTYKQQYKNAQDELYAGINAQKEGHSQEFNQMAYPFNLAMYKYYYIPGYRDVYTQRAYDRLVRLNSLPDYNIGYGDFATGWAAATKGLEPEAELMAYEPKPESSNFLGAFFSKLIIPASSELILRNNLTSVNPYEYAVLNLISPYYGDTAIKLDNQDLLVSSTSVESITLGDKTVTKQALIFGDGKFTSGNSSLEIHLMNNDTTPLAIYLNLMLIADNAKAEVELPTGEEE